MGSRFPRPWAVAIGLALLAGIALAFVPRTSVTALLLFDVPVGVATAAAWDGARRMWRVRRAPWLTVALCLTAFFVGELIWWVLQLKGLDPYPSAADPAFIAASITMGIGALLLVRGGAEPDGAAWLDAGVLAVVAGLVYWVALVEPATRATHEPLIARLFSLAYPMADLLVLALVLRLMLHRGARTPATDLFTAGVGLMLLADVAFSWMDLHGTDRGSSLVDTVWLAGYMALGSAALHPTAGRPPRPFREPQGIERGRLALVVVAVLVPLGTLVLQFRDLGLLGANTLTVALAAAGGVMTLVAVRLWGLLGRARRLESRRGEERLSALIHHSTDAIVLVDRNLTITFASPAAGEVWNVEPCELPGTDLLSRFTDASRQVVHAGLRRALHVGPDTVLEIEGDTAQANGLTRAVEGTVRNLTDNDAVGALVLTLRDVTERRDLEEQLERRAFHDDLTGLANRALFIDRVKHALDRSARRPNVMTAVVFIDLDDFKAVNDGMGHGAGDHLLVEVATRLRTCVRQADTVARLGGDEFAMLLEDLEGADRAEHLAQRALEMLRMPLHVQDVDLAVPASAGVALASPGSTVESLLQDADIAMYSAKAAGKGRVALFDSRLRDEAHRRLELKVELPEALRLRQFRLEYQPIQDLALGRVRGFEALVRWDHPERGTVGPGDFIAGAEESGLIVELGRWVLREACRQAAEWNRRAGVRLTMNVNVSVVQLRDPELLDDVVSALADVGLAPDLLTVEITESVLVEQHNTMEVLERLRAIGVGIAIDDFGTGYSSLAYLRRFPVTSVKIDRAFVAELTQSGDAALVRSVVAMARALSLTTVAEGVETEEQLATLDNLNCGLAQGYYVGRPQRPEHWEPLISGLGAPAVS